jgi:hypothetical protein
MKRERKSVGRLKSWSANIRKVIELEDGKDGKKEREETWGAGGNQDSCKQTK